ncbi:hypothetical protein BJP40_12050 [Streptomyces sp. CC53]|uniref:hypothetical protein n=1 Tax=Streptomyces sp. CC53 TaxID=1906740 RepID=UPI0008DE0F61|nr:hypothetical protein [Streptomyces sp. CC53]OII59996.1 hypothetical protein BJP40_12050 [Streptomyces sp. CC53]
MSNPDFTPDEIDKATSQFIAFHVEPLAQRTGRHPVDILADLSEEVFSLSVLAYMLGNRAAAKDPGVNVRAEAAVLFLGMLRQTPGQEANAAALTRQVYEQARAEATDQR